MIPPSLHSNRWSNWKDTHLGVQYKANAKGAIKPFSVTLGLHTDKQANFNSNDLCNQICMDIAAAWCTKTFGAPLNRKGSTWWYYRKWIWRSIHASTFGFESEDDIGLIKLTLDQVNPLEFFGYEEMDRIWGTNRY